MKHAISLLILPLLFLAGFAGSALATSDEPLLDLAKPVLDAILGGEYWLGAALALVLATALLSRYAPWKFLKGGEGKALLVLSGAFGGSLANSLIGGEMMSLDAAKSAAKLAIGAAGGYSLIKALIVPWLDRLGAKAWFPGFLKPVLRVATWLFRNPLGAAEKAGDDAVAANPSTGLNGAAGEPTDVP